METKQGRVNPILPLIMSLGSPSFRQDVHRVLQQVTVPPPYDSCIQEIMGRQGVIEEKDLIKFGALYLNEYDVGVMKKLGDFDESLGLQYLEELIAIRNLELIERQLSEGGDPGSILAKVKDTASTSLSIIQKPRAKRIIDLDKNDDEYLFEFLRYPWSKGNLHILCAYSGIGKTSVSLMLAKVASMLGLNVLYISITDWSESSMYRKIAPIANEMDIWYAIYNECTIFQVEAEIKHTKPDVVIVDSLKSISSYYHSDMKTWEELGKRAYGLRYMAVDYDTCMVTTHQLVTMEAVVRPDHLQGAKSHLMEPCDLMLGIGVDTPDQKDRVVSTLKRRNGELIPPFRIMLDHNKLEIQDIGAYVSPQNQQGRIRV